MRDASSGWTLRRHAWDDRAKQSRYDGKNLEKMVDQISGFVDELDKVFPVEGVCHKLAAIEIEEVEDKASLITLTEAARGIDASLFVAAAQKIDAIAGRNSARDIETADSARVQLGNVFTEAALDRAILVKDQTTNSVERAVAKGESGIQIGNTYGGKGLWDR
jgi:hypothetical protein